MLLLKPVSICYFDIDFVLVVIIKYYHHLRVNDLFGGLVLSFTSCIVSFIIEYSICILCRELHLCVIQL